jgi:hypothetical protein
VWWCTSAVLVLGRLRQEDLVFKASLNYIVRPLSQKGGKERGREKKKKNYKECKKQEAQYLLKV